MSIKRGVRNKEFRTMNAGGVAGARCLVAVAGGGGADSIITRARLSSPCRHPISMAASPAARSPTPLSPTLQLNHFLPHDG